MKPLQQPAQDSAALEELGRACVQIVHDLKNQLNGLKLYATFLRKRAERDGRPADELETIGKIIAGLERSAAAADALVRFGRPVELRRAAHSDLAELLRSATGGDSAALDLEAGPFRGDFDTTRLAEALRDITSGVRSGGAGEAPQQITLRRAGGGGPPSAIVEWRGARAARDGSDLFASFAGGAGLRLALAAKIIRAHGGAVEQRADAVAVRLPLTE